VRVLLIVNTLPPTDVSGVGEQVLQLAAALRDEGHEVEVLGRGADGARGPKVLFPLMVLGPLARALRRFRPHVVQVHESDGAVAALVVATVRALLEPVPLLVALLQVSYLEEMKAVRLLRADGRVVGEPTFSERAFFCFKAPLQVALGWVTVWLADVVLAPSQQTATEIQRDYQVGSVRVLPNITGGGEVDRVELPAPREGEEYLLFVGRLRIRKGVEILLEALARLCSRFPGLRLLVAGDGEQGPSLERRAASLQLTDRVDFLGRSSAGEVRQLLGGARALVVPSIYEGMPLVILEAMEASVPVIASRVSGIPEVVEDGVTGWLVPPENIDELARAVEEAWQDSEESNRRGAAGRQRLERDFRPPVASRIWLREMSAVMAPALTQEAEREE
jgi:glycosyltransferase involved in cell wall biosynthesis